MNRDLRDFLHDILLHIEQAQIAFEKSEKPLTYPTPETMIMIYCLQIIGEAVKHIPDEVRDRHPEIAWKRVAGMRDVLIHRYWGIDLEVVEESVVRRLPEVEAVMKTILQKFEN
jgi:uncharacterized protein with HEPN domain